MGNTTSNSLISVIVPVYNVERYLAKCIDSIIGLTYKNLEIIIIDDGSPDNSGNIADEYSQIDERIRVIHTKNRGVSAARNLGIEESKGEYIAFVDSDDCLMPDFVEYMLGIVEKTGSNFAMSRNCFKSRNETQIENDKIEIYSPEKAAAELLYPWISIGCWNKLFHRDFIIQNNIRFPETFFMGEGLNFIVTAALLSNGVGVGLRKVYYYRKDNPDSITTVVRVDKMINALAAIDNIEKSTIVNTSDLRMALKWHKYATTFIALSSIIKTHSEKIYSTEYQEILSVIKKDAFSMMQARISIYEKMWILVYATNPIFLLKIRCFLSETKRKLFAK